MITIKSLFTRETILILSLTLNIIALGFAVRRIYHMVFDVKFIERSHYWLGRDQLFENLPKDSGSIVFLGTSLTQHFEFSEIFQNTKIKNRGINGDNIPGALNRINSIIELQPAKIFIELGINDLGKGVTVDSIIINYEKLLNNIQKNCKRTEIYIQSLFPVENDTQMLPLFVSPDKNGDIKEVNRRLKHIALKRGISFIDMYAKFEKNGELNLNYSVDGVHLSGQGYLLWASLLKVHISP